MGVFNTKIGDHLVQFKCNSFELKKYLLNNFPFLSDLEIGQNDLLITIEDGYGECFINYIVEVNEENNTLSYRRADYLIEVDTDFKSATIKVHNELALKHGLMNLYSAFIVHHNWGLLIHSSCVIEGGKAHVFAGQSGAGKSTAARLSMPRELLSDEATLVKITEDGIMIYDSPFRSEISGRAMVKKVPLASVQILKQALTNNRLPIKKADSLIHMLDKVFYWVHSPDETKQIINLLKMLVDQVPAYELYFRKDPTFWELIS